MPRTGKIPAGKATRGRGGFGTSPAGGAPTRRGPGPGGPGRGKAGAGRRPGFGPRPGFEEKPEFGGKPASGAKPGFGGKPAFGAKPGFGGKPAPGGRPAPGGKPGFGGKAGAYGKTGRPPKSGRPGPERPGRPVHPVRERAARPAPPPGDNRAVDTPDLLTGRNPVLEALKAGHPLTRILVARGGRSGTIPSLVAMARELGVPVQEVERARLDQVAGPGHQGIAAFAAAKEYVELDDLLTAAQSKGEEPLIVVLDSLEDPHNLGSILRTADAVGAHGVVIPKHRTVGLTTTVAKTSAGAVEYVPVARVSNLAQALEQLKKAGLWVVGADQDAAEDYTSARLSGPLAVVVGGEGKGLSRLSKEKCDFLVRLPMRGHINSLNAGVAAAILLYEVTRQRDATH